ncbi:sirohydrochlorin chelatase [Thermodesulfovibrio yellowstonii]|uniref:sirohydrochlorin chelatase n=1 Tax=Thermodesulfovibrio yellowstonii TaxID=28262 RepID=UPI0024908DA6|nr:CbiX/SirB N-terminal domain-containing protein [Thermodesulfovibrio islandicus]
MEKIIIVLHGSLLNHTYELENFIKKLATALKRKPEDVKYAFLQFGSPSLENSISHYIKENVKNIIVHPLFLLSGKHVNSHIPDIIKKFKQNYPDINITCTKPLGLHEKLIDIIIDIIKERIEER